MALTYPQLMQLANAHSESRILLAANDLDVFTVIGTGGRAGGEIAKRCKADPEGMCLFLDALVGLGLLSLRGGSYRNTPLGRRYLDRRSPTSISNLLWLLGHHWHDWTTLPHALRKGRPGRAPVTRSPEFRRRFSLAMHERSHVLAAPTVATIRLSPRARHFLDLGHHWHDWTKLPQALRKGRPGWGSGMASAAFRRRFSLAMHERSHVLAAPTVATIRLSPRARHFLDLGGGPGSYAIALAKRYPRLEGVVLDQTVTVTRQLILQEGLGARLKARAGNIFKADLGTGYDAVLVSNVIHVFNEKETTQLLRRVRDALRPGGKVFIVEFFLDDSRTRPPKSSVFSLMMYLFTATGRCYSWSETEGLLARLGFGRFKRHTVTPDIGTLEATKLRS